MMQWVELRPIGSSLKRVLGAGVTLNLLSAALLLAG